MEERQWMMRNPFMVAAMVVLGIGLTVGALLDPTARLPMVLVLAVALGFATGRLDLRDDADALRLTYFPFWRRRIAWSDMRAARAEEYRALHYGGWGIRFGRGAMAYSVWGKQAVRIVLDGRDLVFTTRRPDEWLDVLRVQGVPIEPATRA